MICPPALLKDEQMDPVTAIALSTARISSFGHGTQSVGTGYFYLFEFTHEGRYATSPVIVTNKHVIDGAETVKLDLQLLPDGSEIKMDGTAEREARFEVELMDIQGGCVRHPDPNVDLCVIPVGSFYFGNKPALPKNFRLKHLFLTKDWRLNETEREFLRPVEPIRMIGYPNGLWDEVNNRPIARQGSTASHALLNWNGRREFVIDAACFPGSSGSPVFLFEDGMRREAGGVTAGTRIKHLGTLWGGPTISATGRIESRPIPTSTNVEPFAVTTLMMNLGFVIPADALDDIGEIIRARMQLPGKLFDPMNQG